ncbi:hypothetical protein N658DRAFT_490618 [Parathielavia hyrcaniae]|uniref:Uncharacterized protein n=1 Tax=Parathielavia hyrcaniae TaxID=113614 RepID=A0AAN6Q9E2_9PEZI|nr:hypothetical protein N658DRAFT_490618 [Parathielavia hyrcaniae]
MASYDPYDAPPRERTSKRYYREDRREERDPRYYESRETLHVLPSRDLVPRAREDSDLSVEEIRRDFPPPGYSSRDMRRARSAEPGHDDYYDDRRSHYARDRDYDDYDHKPRGKAAAAAAYEEERKKKARMLSKQEQIIAAMTGAALAIGGKELYDRRSAKEHGSPEVERNLLASAALGAAGALAGYQGTEFYNKHKEKEEKKALAKYGYYSDEDETPKEKKGHKNFLEGALAAAGLGGAVKALTGGKDDKSDTRSRRGSRSRSRSRSRSTSRSRDRSGGKNDAAGKVQKAAMASLIAGATEAFRISKQPGSWKGEKAKRILTAAAGAATLDAAQDTDKAGSKLGLAEAVVGGLLGNRVLNGSKKNIEMDEKTGRSRSRSRARSKDHDGGSGGASGLAALATAGLGALAGKKLMDNHERSRSRNRSVDSRNSRDGSPDRRRHRSRSRSVVDSARRRLAKVGIGNGPEDDDRDRRDRRRDQDDYEDSGRSRRHRDDYDDYDTRDRSRDRHRRDDYDDDRSHHHGGAGDRPRHRRGSVSSDGLGDSEDDRKRGKKLRAPPGADRHDDGPRYVDGNPYAAILPAGSSERR